MIPEFNDSLQCSDINGTASFRHKSVISNGYTQATCNIRTLCYWPQNTNI